MARFLILVMVILLAIAVVGSVSAGFSLNADIIPTLMADIKPTPSTTPGGKPLPVYPPEGKPLPPYPPQDDTRSRNAE